MAVKRVCCCCFIYISALCFVLFLDTTAVWQFVINEYVILCYATDHIYTTCQCCIRGEWFGGSVGLLSWQLSTHSSSSIFILHHLGNVRWGMWSWQASTAAGRRRVSLERCPVWLTTTWLHACIHSSIYRAHNNQESQCAAISRP